MPEGRRRLRLCATLAGCVVICTVLLLLLGVYSMAPKPGLGKEWVYATSLYGVFLYAGAPAVCHLGLVGLFLGVFLISTAGILRMLSRRRDARGAVWDYLGYHSVAIAWTAIVLGLAVLLLEVLAARGMIAPIRDFVRLVLMGWGRVVAIVSVYVCSVIALRAWRTGKDKAVLTERAVIHVAIASAVTLALGLFAHAVLAGGPFLLYSLHAGVVPGATGPGVRTTLFVGFWGLLWASQILAVNSFRRSKRAINGR